VGAPEAASTATVAKPASRRASSTVNDQLVEKEMDVVAVERTRSYRAWQELPEGCEMVYNQKYVKGHPGHDWLLRKNIWRRMRYRRDCKRLVDELRTGGDGGDSSAIEAASAAPAVFKSSTQSHPSQGTNAKRRTRSQTKKQRKDYSIQQERDPQQHPLPMDTSMDDTHDSVDDTHESKSLDQLLDESTNRIVQSVKVGLLDATTMMTAAAAAAAVEGSNAVGHHLLMPTDSDSMPLGHHHSAMVAADEEDAVAAAVAAADQEAIEAAVAAAESFGKSGHILAEALASGNPHRDQNSASVGVQDHHDHPMDAAALDAAAKLAAAAVLGQEGEDADAVAATAAAVAASTKNLYKVNVHMV
jgi:hypothetical protein